MVANILIALSYFALGSLFGASYATYFFLKRQKLVKKNETDKDLVIYVI